MSKAPTNPKQGQRKLCADCGKRFARRKGKDCEACKSRKRDERYPEQRVCRNIKISAKRRGIRFALEPADIKALPEWEKYGGWNAESLTIDRIDPDPKIGYAPGNIQMMTRSQNSVKRWEDERRNPDIEPF